VIDALSASTFLTLLGIPTLYEVFNEPLVWFGRKLGFSTPEATEHKIPMGAPSTVIGD
jgi:hypothetical protein